MKQVGIELTRTEVDHLLTTLRDESRGGHYYGNPQQFRNRQHRLMTKLERAYEDIARAEGWPMKPSKIVRETPQ